MFNLIVETARKVVTEQTAVAEVLRSRHLVLVKVGIGRVCATIGEVIDLGIDHEAYAEYGTWQCCPDECFPQWESKVGPNMHDKYVSHPPKNVCHKPWSRQG